MSTNDYTFLGLCNDILEALNEVPLSASTFAGASGFHKHVKNSVNAAIEDIYNEEDNEWPWQVTEGTINSTGTGKLIAGTSEYDINSDAIWVNWDSFYIDRDATLDRPDHVELKLKDWDYYRDYLREDSINGGTNARNKPQDVIRTEDNKALFNPIPDDTYTVKYNYFADFTPLSADTDVPSVPQQYRKCIYWGAMRYAYEFRDDRSNTDRAVKYWEDWVNKMRRSLIPQDNVMRFEP